MTTPTPPKPRRTPAQTTALVNKLFAGAPLTPLVPTAEFLALIAELGIEFEPGDLEKLGLYLAALLHANAAFNLTAINSPDQAWSRHIFDALTLMPLLAEVPQVIIAAEPPEQLTPSHPAPAARLIDIGSGGGLPAIPLAITLPHIHFTLVEPTGKKATFLRSVVELLGLTNVTVLQDRAERLGQNYRHHREMYHFATARAVAPLPTLAEYLAAFLGVGGLAIAVKGERAEQEIIDSQHALATLGLEHSATVVTPTGQLIVLEKIEPTPKPYPRRDGEPKRVPLGSAPVSKANPNQAARPINPIKKRK